MPTLVFVVAIGDVTERMVPPAVLEQLRRGAPAGTLPVLAVAGGGLHCTYEPVPGDDDGPGDRVNPVLEPSDN
jgi:hypothetical protein